MSPPVLRAGMADLPRRLRGFSHVEALRLRTGSPPPWRAVFCPARIPESGRVSRTPACAPSSLSLVGAAARATRLPQAGGATALAR